MTTILYTIGRYTIRPELAGSGRFRPKSQTFAVYQDGAAAATRVARMPTLERAITEAHRRHESEVKV